MPSNIAARRAAKANRRKAVLAQKRKMEQHAGSLGGRVACLRKRGNIHGVHGRNSSRARSQGRRLRLEEASQDSGNEHATDSFRHALH